jgi:putative transcriptional regulator
MKSLAGHFLIAGATMLDPNFAHAIVLLVQHDGDGAMGLVLNQPTELSVRKAWEQVREESCAVEGEIHRGGPCEGPLMALHTHAQASQIEVIEGVHFCADAEQVEWLIQQNAGPMKFCVGYAGWTAGQLEQELATESWEVLQADRESVFSDDAKLWERLLRRAGLLKELPGINPKIIPDDPSVN